MNGEPIRERLKLLLKAHHNDIQPSHFTADEGVLLLRQGEPADQVLLLSEGSVAIQVRQPNREAHTLAVLEAEELLGEMGLFGTGFHSADVRVIEGPAQLISVPADQLLQALLFDSDLSIEMLSMLSHRCLLGNLLIAELLDAIAAASKRREGIGAKLPSAQGTQPCPLKSRRATLCTAGHNRPPTRNTSSKSSCE